MTGPAVAVQLEHVLAGVGVRRGKAAPAAIDRVASSIAEGSRGSPGAPSGIAPEQRLGDQRNGRPRKPHDGDAAASRRRRRGDDRVGRGRSRVRADAPAFTASRVPSRPRCGG